MCRGPCVTCTRFPLGGPVRVPPGVLNANLGLCTRRPALWVPQPGVLPELCRLPSGLTWHCCLCLVASMLVFQGQVLSVRASAGFSLGWLAVHSMRSPPDAGSCDLLGGSQGSLSCHPKDTLVVCVQRAVTNGIAGQHQTQAAGEATGSPSPCPLLSDCAHLLLCGMSGPLKLQAFDDGGGTCGPWQCCPLMVGGRCLLEVPAHSAAPAATYSLGSRRTQSRGDADVLKGSLVEGPLSKL